MATNDLYQSTFMPIFQRAETKIKESILVSFLMGLPLTPLRLKIDGIIKWAVSHVPPDLHDKTAYFRGLKVKSEQYILLYYKKPEIGYKLAKSELMQSLPKGHKPPIVDNPQQLFNFVSNKKNLWAEAKGNPNVVDYAKKLKKTLNDFANAPMTTAEKGKKPISLWQKAELDVRHQAQIEETQKLINEGVDLVWISSHPNCSKRCECWQGEVFSLTKHAKNPQTKVDKKFNYNKRSFEVGEVEGHKIYSLPDVMAVVDKYGYNNNIISGFNCRHRRTPYILGSSAPKEYTAQEIAKQRQIEANMREMEREIRNLKTRELFYTKIRDDNSARAYKNAWKSLEAKYKAYCESNGYAWYQYRINI